MSFFQPIAAITGLFGFLCWSSNLYAVQPLALQLGPFGESSFVLDDSGVLWAWGSNRGSQFGDGGTNSSLNGIPMPLPEGVDAWTRVSGGSAFAALDSSGRIFGWGQYESDHNGFDMPIQRTPTLIDAGAWSTIAVTTARYGVKDVPWALAATVTGELFWVRVPPPSLASSPPFSAHYTEPAPGVEGAGAFVQVEGGSRFFLALTDIGRVFAAGVGDSGCLGPAGDLQSKQFQKSFVEIEAPEPGMTWTRIAAGDGQAFAWSSSNDLYVWGERFDLDEGWIIDPVPRKVPRPPGGSLWVDAKSSGATTLLLTGLGEIYAAASDRSGWVSQYANGTDILRERSRLAMAGSDQGVRSLSTCSSHALLQGSNGRFRAIGDNDSLQLGALIDFPDFHYTPVTPGGQADFLLGRDADVPIVSLSQSSTEILEPVTSLSEPSSAGQLELKRIDHSNVTSQGEFIVTVFHADGTPIEGPSADALFKQLFRFSRGLSFGVGLSTALNVVEPLFAPDLDEDYRIRIELPPSPYYTVSGPSSFEFLYRHTTPLNRPPTITQIWPPTSGTVYADDVVRYRFELRDVDGYPTNVVLRLQGPGPVFHKSISLPPSTPNVPQVVEFSVPVSLVNWWNVGIRTVTVEDNAHASKRVTLPELQLSSQVVPRVTVMIRGKKLTLSMDARDGELVLEASDDLKTWTPLESFLLPPPANASLNVSIDPDFMPHRFFRLVDPIP